MKKLLGLLFMFCIFLCAAPSFAASNSGTPPMQNPMRNSGRNYNIPIPPPNANVVYPPGYNYSYSVIPAIANLNLKAGLEKVIELCKKDPSNDFLQDIKKDAEVVLAESASESNIGLKNSAMVDALRKITEKCDKRAKNTEIREVGDTAYNTLKSVGINHGRVIYLRK